ncbi:MAG: hypothetical protein A2148_04915 [Chloroflexi bacterium RBG_16_68_14]|nr:MAG: hypothetical protein A2148_04915 [Chloroflexi bacterium RBG_16_68_14]
MNEDGEAPLETLFCGRCATVCDPEDNFCRQCGLPLREQYLPSVREGRELPAVWQPSLPAAVVKGAVFVAAGTLGQRLLRSLLRRALQRRRPAPRTPARRAKGEVVPRQEELLEDIQLESETFLLRRVRIRR